MSDTFAQHQPGLTAPARDCVPVTPSDSTDLDPPARSLMIGLTGTLRVTMINGTQRDLAASVVPSGAILPLHVKRVHATGTTATPIYALT